MTIKLIAEIGNNHNGDIALAKSMAEAAIEAGADFVKFQAYVPETFLAAGCSYFDELADEALPLSAFGELKDYVEAKGARFLCVLF